MKSQVLEILSEYGNTSLIVEYSDKKLKKGDVFTISGYGKSDKGHDVVNGKSVKTGRKMKVKEQSVFTVKKVKG